MAVFAHPDDEIGAAGTLALHARRGDEVLQVWMTRGELASQRCNQVLSRKAGQSCFRQPVSNQANASRRVSPSARACTTASAASFTETIAP